MINYLRIFIIHLFNFVVYCTCSTGCSCHTLTALTLIIQSDEKHFNISNPRKQTTHIIVPRYISMNTHHDQDIWTIVLVVSVAPLLKLTTQVVIRSWPMTNDLISCRHHFNWRFDSHISWSKRWYSWCVWQIFDTLTSYVRYFLEWQCIINYIILFQSEQKREKHNMTSSHPDLDLDFYQILMAISNISPKSV